MHLPESFLWHRWRRVVGSNSAIATEDRFGSRNDAACALIIFFAVSRKNCTRSASGTGLANPTSVYNKLHTPHRSLGKFNKGLRCFPGGKS
jgi:hypothetical protein